MQYEVTEDWTATYDAPVVLSAGETIELSGRQDIWDGHIWLWAKSPAGKEGWIPDSLVRTINGKHVAGEDYSAIELTCKRGQIVTGVEETHGWVLCRAEGRTGWVPKNHLAVRTA
jgi:hypothetical protein